MHCNLFILFASLFSVVSCLEVDLDSLDFDLNSGSIQVSSASKYAIATLVSSEEYVHGAIALAGIDSILVPIIIIHS